MSNLRLLNESSITSNVSQVNVTDMFTSDFDIYKVTVTNLATSGTSASRVDGRLININGGIATADNYDRAELSMHAHTSFQELTSQNEDIMFDYLPSTDLAPEFSSGVIYFFNPFSASSYTFMLVQGFASIGGQHRSAKGIFAYKQLESIAGLSLISATGDTFASGTIRTYGLRVDT
jgi:hypothetical protein